MAQEIQKTGCSCVDAKPTAAAAGNVGIRAVERGDGPALHALLTASIPDVLPDRARWLARWEWQYWQNPFRKDRPAGWVFADADRILGHLGVVYLPMRIGDRRVSGVVGADYAVAEKFLARGGMFAGLELAQKLFTDCGDCVVMATTANEKTGVVFGRFGGRAVEWTREFWRAPATLGQQIRSCRGGDNRALRRMMTGHTGQWFSRVMTAGYKLTRHLPAIPIPQGCRLEIAEPRLARDLGDLSQQMAGPTNCLCVDRSQDYLDWRYGRHPERKHMRVLTVCDVGGSPLAAAMVFHEQRHDRHVCYVEEMMVMPHRSDILRTLLCAALRLAYQHGSEYLVTSPGQRAIRDVFWELGFEDRARSAPAVVVCIPTSVASVASSASNATFTSFDDHLEFWHGMMF